MLLIPDLYALDIDLDLPDRAPGKARSSVDPQGAEYITTLQQARHLEIERARAEWRGKKRNLGGIGKNEGGVGCSPRRGHPAVAVVEAAELSSQHPFPQGQT